MIDKIESAKRIIKQSLYFSEKPLIMFSGGKDSTVILHLIRSIKHDVIALFENTGVEARETIEYCNTIDNLVVVKPEKGITFWTLCKKYGYPDLKQNTKSHNGNHCCVHLKKKPAQKYQKQHGTDLIFLRLTSAESRNRMMLFKRMGALYWNKTEQVWHSNPIYNWTETDVWNYIKKNNILYNKSYDLGWKRCGCMPCSAHIGWQERLAREDPKLLRVLLKKRYGQMSCGDYRFFGHDINNKNSD